MASLIEIDCKIGPFAFQMKGIQKNFQDWSNISSYNDHEKWDVILNPFGILEDKYKFALVDESGDILAIMCQDYNCDTNIAEFDCIIPNPATSTEKILIALYDISKKEGWHAVQFSTVYTSNIVREDKTCFRTISDLERLFREYGLQKLTKNHVLRIPRQSTVGLSDSDSDSDSELDLLDSLRIEYDKWVWPIQSFKEMNFKTKSPWDTNISISIYGGSSETHTTKASIVKYTRDHSFKNTGPGFTDKKTKFISILFETPLVYQVKPDDKGDRYFDMTINGRKYGPNCCSNISSEFWKCQTCFCYRRFNKLFNKISQERLGTTIVYGIEIPSHLLSREGGWDDFGYFTDISRMHKGYLHAVHYNFASFIHNIGIPCHSLALTTSDGAPTPCFTKFPEISPPAQILETPKIPKTPKTPKSTIPKVVRNQVWDKWIGADIGRTKCYVCQTNIIDKGGNFHCGHVIAESKGGELKVDNLRPICKSCNSSMGTQDMREFCKKHYRDTLDHPC